MTGAVVPTAMFPLGSPLLPGALLPLHIFEQRYQIMLNEVLEGDRSFGVALITRGHEVGGGDQRTTIATRARILEHQRFDDGRAAVIVQGEQRIEVVEWLADDPYPQARVSTIVEAPLPSAAAQSVDDVRQLLEQIVDHAIALQRLDAAPEFPVPDDPDTALWQLLAMAPVGAHDRQRVLECDDFAGRASLVARLLGEVRDDLANERRLQ